MHGWLPLAGRVGGLSLSMAGFFFLVSSDLNETNQRSGSEHGVVEYTLQGILRNIWGFFLCEILLMRDGHWISLYQTSKRTWVSCCESAYSCNECVSVVKFVIPQENVFLTTQLNSKYILVTKSWKNNRLGVKITMCTPVKIITQEDSVIVLLHTKEKKKTITHLHPLCHYTQMLNHKHTKQLILIPT